MFIFNVKSPRETVIPRCVRGRRTRPIQCLLKSPVIHQRADLPKKAYFEVRKLQLPVTHQQVDCGLLKGANGHTEMTPIGSDSS